MNKMFLTMKLFIYLYTNFILFLFFFFFSYFVHTFDQKVKTKIELLKKEKSC